jgi:hypothetical protein
MAVALSFETAAMAVIFSGPGVRDAVIVIVHVSLAVRTPQPSGVEKVTSPSVVKQTFSSFSEPGSESVAVATDVDWPSGGIEGGFSFKAIPASVKTADARASGGCPDGFPVGEGAVAVAVIVSAPSVFDAVIVVVTTPLASVSPLTGENVTSPSVVNVTCWPGIGRP